MDELKNNKKSLRIDMKTNTKNTSKSRICEGVNQNISIIKGILIGDKK